MIDPDLLSDIKEKYNAMRNVQSIVVGDIRCSYSKEEITDKDVENIRIRNKNTIWKKRENEMIISEWKTNKLKVNDFDMRMSYLLNRTFRAVQKRRHELGMVWVRGKL